MDSALVDLRLLKGNLVAFLKQFNKQRYRLLEEEINLLMELYFSNVFGTKQLTIGSAQLKSQHVVDWRLLEQDLDLQEYFFNIKQNLITPAMFDMKFKFKSTSAIELQIEQIKANFWSACHAKAIIQESEE